MFETNDEGSRDSGDSAVPSFRNSSVAAVGARPGRPLRPANSGHGRPTSRGSTRRPSSRTGIRALRAGTGPAEGAAASAEVSGDDLAVGGSAVGESTADGSATAGRLVDGPAIDMSAVDGGLGA